jgi:hypothetical protein
MDVIIARIKTYVLIIDNTITNDAYLDYIINDVVDRVLLITNRDQLVAQYELDLEDDTVESEDYELPIPSNLERPIAMIIVQQIQQFDQNKVIDTMQVKSISDNGQSVSYGDTITSFFASQDDGKVFNGISELLNRVTIPRTAKNIVRKQDYYDYPTNF